MIRVSPAVAMLTRWKWLVKTVAISRRTMPRPRSEGPAVPSTGRACEGSCWFNTVVPRGTREDRSGTAPAYPTPDRSGWAPHGDGPLGCREPPATSDATPESRGRRPATPARVGPGDRIASARSREDCPDHVTRHVGQAIVAPAVARRPT